MKNDITIIVGTDKNNAIGKDNDIPWYIPEDFKYFRERTMDKPLVLGRRTWESLPKKPLPNRNHYIITRNEDYEILTDSEDGIESVMFFNNLEDALNAARLEQKEIMVIGGAEIYKQALPYTDKILRTLIDLEVHGDTYFPIITEDFELVRSDSNLSSEGVKYTFETYERKL